MKNRVLDYIQHQISKGSARLRNHSTSPQGESYPQRHIYKKLEKHLNDFRNKLTEQRWLVIPGLRGVGKTTVLSQLFLKLIADYDPLRILYISLDEVVGLLDSSLQETLDAYEMILGQSFENLKKPIFIFIDEVQYDSHWGITLKSLFDRSKKVFICVTGSSAVSLQTNPDVYRRVLITKLYPLSFPEYQMLKHNIYPPKGLKGKLKEALYESNNAQEVFEKLQPLQTEILQYWSRIDKLEIQQYLTQGTLPFALQFNNKNQLYDTIHGLLDKIILKDIESLKSFDSKTLKSIKRLLFLLADANDVISVNKFHNIIGIENKVTIQNVLNVLEQAEILIRAIPRGSQKNILNKPSKYLFMSPAIRMALLGIVGKEATYHVRMGKLLEDIVALHFCREFISSGIGTLSYDPASGGADFIFQIANQKQIAVEVGLGKNEIKQTKKTMEKIHCDYGLVIGNEELRYFSDSNITSIPLQYFLLM